MSSENWNGRSLAELKAIVDDVSGGMLAQLRTSSSHFRSSAQSMDTAESDLMGHMGALRDGWHGKAASAAIANAQQNAATMNQTSSSSSAASDQTDNYLHSVERDQRQARAVPNVDTSWGHAFSSGGWAGPIGVGAAKYEQQKKYDDNHSKMVAIVTRMDTEGSAHSQEMKSADWPSGMPRQGSPPSTLPPVPGSHSAGAPGGGSSPGYTGGGTNPGTGGYTPVVMGPVTDPNDSAVFVASGNKGKDKDPNKNDPTQTQSGSSPTPQIPTVTQSGPGGVDTPGAPGTGPVGATPPTTGGGGPGAAGVVLGGAGLLGAGAAGGGLRGGTGGRAPGLAGEEEGRLGSRGAGGIGEAEGEPRFGGVRGGAFGEGESGMLRGPGGIGDTDGMLRGGPRSGGIPPEEELGVPRDSALAGGRPSGFGGEPVAAEAGRFGGYPMGGAGGRRSGDDEEAPVPDYLVETDDVWGDGVTAAPPVIGE